MSEEIKTTAEEKKTLDTLNKIEKYLSTIKKKDDILFDNYKSYGEQRRALHLATSEANKHIELYIMLMRLLQSMKVQSAQREIVLKQIEEQAPFMENVIRYLN